VKGNSVFKGYFRRDDLTKAAFEEGWFLTGDVAAIVDNGRIKYIDRINNIRKLKQGISVVP
jgi:long-chain acyl-CoA synthetase